MPKQGLDASPPCHSYVTVEEKFRHYSASMRDAKIGLSRVKTVVSINRRYFAPEFVMRRSGVRFISPAPNRSPRFARAWGFFASDLTQVLPQIEESFALPADMQISFHLHIKQHCFIIIEFYCMKLASCSFSAVLTLPTLDSLLSRIFWQEVGISRKRQMRIVQACTS